MESFKAAIAAGAHGIESGELVMEDHLEVH
jgi:hypothetical protein